MMAFITQVAKKRPGLTKMVNELKLINRAFYLTMHVLHTQKRYSLDWWKHIGTSCLPRCPRAARKTEMDETAMRH